VTNVTRGAAACLVALVLFALAGCSAGRRPGMPLTPTSPATTPATSTATSWIMPDLVGQNLQDAQNAIRMLTGNAIIVTTSSDASGQGRQQMRVSNWKVCSQYAAAGETITRTSRIDFAVVKLDEDCP
jgi:hypothetical protein